MGKDNADAITISISWNGKVKKCMYLLKCSGKSGKWYFRSWEVTKLNENWPPLFIKGTFFEVSEHVNQT